MLVRLKDANVVPTGAIKVITSVTILPILVVLVCIYCYIVAVNKGEVDPFPNCTITNTATGYPQDIAFRTIMTPAMVYFILMMRTIYLMLTGIAARVGRNGSVPCEIWYFGLIGSLLYGITMATITNGEMAGKLHSISAVIFFLLFIIDIVLINKQLAQLRAIDQSIISQESLRLKQIIGSFIVWTVIIELIHLIISKILGVELWHERVPARDGFDSMSIVGGTDAEICIIEWVAVYGFAIYFYTFRTEWKNYAYVLTVDVAKIGTRSNLYDVISPIFGTPAAHAHQPLVQCADAPLQVEMGATATQRVVLGTVVHPQNVQGGVVMGVQVPRQ